MKSKESIAAAISSKTGVSKEDVKRVFDEYHELVTSTLNGSDDAQVLLPGIGTFRKTHRAERQGRNPSTGEPMTIAAAYAPGLKFRKGFKDALND